MAARLPVSYTNRPRARISLVSREDRVPWTLHSSRPAAGPTDPQAARDRLGAFRYAPQFQSFLEQGLARAVGPLAGAADTHERAGLWWRNPYLLSRLSAHFHPMLVSALVWRHQALALLAAWEDEIAHPFGSDDASDEEQPASPHWTREVDEDDPLWRQQRELVSLALSQVAAQCRAAMGLAPAKDGEHARDWLTRRDREVLTHVHRTFYPTRATTYKTQTTSLASPALTSTDSPENPPQPSA